jgi:hypothetical protein
VLCSVSTDTESASQMAPYSLYSQQPTTLHLTAGLPLKLHRVALGWSLDGRPDSAGSDVGGPIHTLKKTVFLYLTR